MNDSERVRRHFDADAQRFDAIYTDEKGLITKIVDRTFRSAVVLRFNLTFERSGDVRGKAALDIGCGSGRYPLRFAHAGAARCVGVDFAPAMIDLAKRAAQEENVADRCEFICTDFLTHEFPQPFDIITAMGFFDYIAEPVEFLRKCKQLTNGVFFASFPVKYEWRVPIRRLRFMLKACPVYFYTEPQVRRLYEEAGFRDFKIQRLPRDYYVEARAR